MAGVAGFEPTHNGVKVRCLTAWRHPKKNGRNSKIRTCGPLLPRQVRYRTALYSDLYLIHCQLYRVLYRMSSICLKKYKIFFSLKNKEKIYNI